MGSAIGSRSNSPRRPRLWMVFAAVGLSVFLFALGGLVVIRVYDDQLIRQTESELIAQGAVVAEAFRIALREQVDVPTYGHVRTAAWPQPIPKGSPLRPILPSLHASDQVFSAVGNPAPSPFPAEARAREAGARLTPLLAEATRATLAGIRIVDVQGVIVATSAGEVGGSLMNREEVQRALAGAPHSLLRLRASDSEDAPLASLSRNTGVRVAVAIPVLDEDRVWGAVVLSRTPMTLAKAAYADRWNLTATGAVLLIVVLIMSVAAATLVVRPVRALVRQTRAIAAQAPEGFEPVRRPVVQELAELSESLANSARALRDRNAYIRSFAANVSHEFKTPLAGIRGAVELLRDSGDEMSPEQRDRFLSNIEKDAERLTRLVQRLLELARADSMSAMPASAELGPLLERVAAQGREDGLQVEVETPEQLPSAIVPPEVLEDILTQLLTNARQHGEADSVRLQVQVLDEITVAVHDDGKGISEANRARIFDAFFTTARARGGTGMGLTIARALLRAFGGELQLAPRSPAGATTFLITLQRK